MIDTTSVIGYERRATVDAPAERVFDAVGTLEGLRGWWTTRVTGAPGQAGAQIRFEFEGLDEHILMRVDELERPSHVRWTCLAHTSYPDWNDTAITFAIDRRTETTCDLMLRHVGHDPNWDYFFASLIAYVERGTGTSYGA
jgi:uncharacterized protein YndB with AHSA1/START domain